MTGIRTSFSVDERHAMFVELRKVMQFNDYAGAMFCWNPDLGVNAAEFSPREPDMIYVRPRAERRPPAPFDELVLEIRSLLPKVVHELVHRRQHSRMGTFRYCICTIPGLYYACLDKEAIAAERAAAVKLGSVRGDYMEFGAGGRR